MSGKTIYKTIYKTFYKRKTNIEHNRPRWDLTVSLNRTIKRAIKKPIVLLFSLSFFILAKTSFATDLIPTPSADPHYTKVGFFDIHVCNWPKRPLFFLILFSSYEHKNVKKVEIFSPSGVNMGSLNLNSFRWIKAKGKKPSKKVFMRQFEIPKQRENGWYKSHITMKNGHTYVAEDYVVIRELSRAKNQYPKANSEDIKAVTSLTWDPIPGAKYYKIFVQDIWNEKSVLDSALLTKPEIKLKPGLLKPGGYYSWRVHARDSNENVLLGDFNHGSLTAPITFSLAEE